MITTKPKGRIDKNNIKTEECSYVPCLYEKPFLIKKPDRTNNSNLKKQLLISLSLYILLIGFYHIITLIFRKHINNSSPYDYAVYFVASIIFWPFIVTYDSQLYYRSCKKLCCLFTNQDKKLTWYFDSAQKYFNMNIKDIRRLKTIPFVITNIVLLFVIFAVYFLKIYMPLPPMLFKLYIVLLICCPLFSILIASYSKGSKNILVTLSVVCCGLSYYTYIMEFSEHKIPALFSKDCVLGSILVALLVCVVFFVAGTTIMPMLGLFKTFYISSFEDKFQYPINDISNSLSVIETIKKYFLHLTGINLLAYFQLLGCVYSLGILDSDSIVTKALFIIGAFFPVAMYLASSFFYKKLCRKIYVKQVYDIDLKIQNSLNNSSIDADSVQTLIMVKEMYENQFEIHSEMSKEVLAVMLTPVITTIAAIVLPASSVIGG